MVSLYQQIYSKKAMSTTVNVLQQPVVTSSHLNPEIRPYGSPNPVAPTISETAIKGSPISKQCAIIALSLAMLSLILSVILQAVFQNDLYKDGINFVYNYQQQQSGQAIKVIQNLISLICSFVLSGVIIGLFFLFEKRKLLVIVHLSYFFLGTCIVAFIRQSLQQPLPFWFDTRIGQWEWFCNGTSGNPSGHCYTALMLLQPIFSDSIGYWRFKAWAFLLGIFFTILPLSRMYLGSHSSNQVLFGVLLGFCALIAYKYVFQKILYEYYWKFFTQKSPKILAIYGILTLIFHAIVFVFPIIIFILYYDEQPLPQFVLNNITQRCGHQVTLQSVQGGNLDACTIGSFFFGMAYGFLFLKPKRQYKIYYLGLWNYQRKWKFILKIIIYGICVAVPYVVFERIATMAVTDYVAKYVLKCVGITLAGIGITFLSPILLWKIKIYEPKHSKLFPQVPVPGTITAAQAVNPEIPTQTVI